MFMLRGLLSAQPTSLLVITGVAAVGKVLDIRISGWIG